MDKNALKEFLQRKYENPEAFLENVIFPVFGEENYDSSGNYHYLHKHPEDINAAESAGIVDILALGSLYVEGSQLDIFDITVSSKSQLANSRVGIQQLIRRIISTHSGAFMIFHYKTSDRWDWRFTFCHKGANALDSTDSKRYTFLLGPGQSCRTAAENFCKLGNKIATDGEFEMNDIIKAFDVEALSKEFFEKYKAQYEKFVNYMADPANGMRADFIDIDFDHEGLTDEQINSREEKPLRDYVKKLLGRIVFLHFIQKKGWLGVRADKEWGEGDLDFMMSLFNKATDAQKDNFLDEILEPLFEMALNTDRSNNNDLFDTKVVGLPNNGILKMPYLNGGLFERESADEPNSVFPADYFNGLLTFLSQYNFTIDENDPNDAQVGIDPEMLGRIFENLLEDNKDKGAFYTPKEIVQYMCKESLISYLQNDADEANKDVIRNFVSSYDVNILDEALRNEVDTKLKNVKICDPAIGSGAFPMGLLKEIFYCRGAIENFDEAAEIKKEIIQNNIYGVDIEKGAVDIARLRFWLSIIVDEKTPHCLPNMDFKIMQGNSLIEDYRGIDLSGIADGSGRKQKKGLEGQLSLMFDEKDVLENLHDQINGYYKLTDHVKKNEARDAINELVRTYIKKYTMDDPTISEEIDALPIPNDKFFLWHTYFADVFKGDNGKSGFDIVIGNPPYIQLQANGGYLGELYKNASFETYARTGDIYCLFYEKGWDILKEHGHLCFITSNKWMRAGYGEKTREFFAKKTNPKLLIDFAGVKVFDTATVDTNILLMSKEKNEGKTTCALMNNASRDCIMNLSDFVQQHHNRSNFSNESNWVILSNIEQSIKRKIEASGTPLKDWDINIYRGVLTGFNDAFVISTEKRDEILAACKTDDERVRSAAIIRPILRGRDIKRYDHDWANLWLINTHNGVKGQIPRINIEDYPSIKAHLDMFWDKLKNRADKGDTPYNLRNCAYLEDFDKPKIVYPDISQRLSFSLSTDKEFLGNTAYFFHSDDMKQLTYLLKVLNSKLIDWYYRNLSVQLGEKAVRMFSIYVLKLPVPQVQYDGIIGLTSDEAIDQYVYSLYGLSSDEIAFIENL